MDRTNVGKRDTGIKGTGKMGTEKRAHVQNYEKMAHFRKNRYNVNNTI